MSQKYKIQLEEEQKLLTDELLGMGAYKDNGGTWQAKPSVQTAPEADMNDLADRNEDFEEKSSIVFTLGERMKDIEKALEKVDSKKFGICEKCGGKIQDERLDANPAASTCMNCLNKI